MTKESKGALSQISFIEINNHCSPEFEAVVSVYQESLPPQVRAPEEDLKNCLIKKSEGVFAQENVDYHLVGLKHSEKTIGMASFSYAQETNIGFLGYIAIKPEFQNQRFGTRLLQKVFEVAREDARKIGKEPLGIIIEVEKEAANPAEKELNERRIRFFKRQGARIIKGIEYWQPPLGEQEAIPLHLMVVPEGAKFWEHLTPEKIAQIVKTVYKKLYVLENDIPRVVAADFTQKIIDSIIPSRLGI